jgi:hypothetical protein
MKNEAMIFAGVVAVSLVTAHVCHTWFPGVAPAIKPMAWPFVCLAVLLVRRLAANRRRRDRDGK